MPFDLTEYRHRFALWTAGRAAQRGFTTVKNLAGALEATDIHRMLARPESLFLERGTFETLHRPWCLSIVASLSRNQQLRGKVTFGRAAKLVAVYLKTLVLMGEHWDTPFGRQMHPPIDRTLLQNMCRRIASSHSAEWKSVNWTMLSETNYYRLIGQLRTCLPGGEPFWKIEEHFDPR